MARVGGSGANGSKLSLHGRGQHPNSLRALLEHGPRPGEARNPEGRNGWEATRRIREEFANALETQVEEGRTLVDVLVERAIGFALEGSSRECWELLRYIAPAPQRLDAEVGLSPEFEDALEELRRRGPYCLEPFTSEAEAEEALPDGSESAN
jgi:hypothetical protein